MITLNFSLRLSYVLILTLSTNIILPMKSEINSKNLFLFIGLPGSGKTSVCQRIAEKNSLMVHKSVGDLLRAEATKGNDRAKYINELVSQGKLVPFEITLNIIQDFLQENTKSIILLDGYQGTVEYIKPFHDFLVMHNITLAKVILFDVSMKTAIERAQSRMRVDDTWEALETRMKTRSENLSHIQQLYASQNLLIRINCENSFENVVYETEKAILSCLRN